MYVGGPPIPRSISLNMPGSGKSSYSTLTDGGNLIIALILQVFAATISLQHLSE